MRKHLKTRVEIQHSGARFFAAVKYVDCEDLEAGRLVAGFTPLRPETDDATA